MATTSRRSVAGDTALIREIAGNLQDELADLHDGDLPAMQKTWAKVQASMNVRLQVKEGS